MLHITYILYKPVVLVCMYLCLQLFSPSLSIIASVQRTQMWLWRFFEEGKLYLIAQHSSKKI